MSSVSKTYLALLQSGIRQTQPPEVRAGILPQVLELSSSQSTMGFVLDAWLRCKDAGEASPEMLQKASACLQGILMGHLNQARALNLIQETLSKEGIEGVLLKGEGLSACYANPMLRQTGDIDLWVGQKAYAQSVACLEKISGGILEEDKEELEKHTALRIGGTVVEVHALTGHAFTRRKDRLYQAYALEGLERGLESVDVSGIRAQVPEPTFNAFYVFHHFFCHFMQGGVGLRQVADWIVLLESRRDAIDWNRLGEMVSRMGLERPWKVFMRLGVLYLGLPSAFMEESGRLDGTASRVLDLILEEGNFGRSRKRAPRSGGYLHDKALSLWEHVRRNLTLLGLFPRQTVESFWQVFSRSMRAVRRDLTLKTETLTLG